MVVGHTHGMAVSKHSTATFPLPPTSCTLSLLHGFRYSLRQEYQRTFPPAESGWAEHSALSAQGLGQRWKST